jgi:hypothetical protein
MSRHEHQKGDLEFAAAYGDGQQLLEQIRNAAEARGYRIELQEPSRPITYDTRLVMHRRRDCIGPVLFPHDPYYGMRILAAAVRFGVHSPQW